MHTSCRLRDVSTCRMSFSRVVLRPSAGGGQCLVLVTLFGTLRGFQNRRPRTGTVLDFYIFFFFFFRKRKHSYTNAGAKNFVLARVVVVKKHFYFIKYLVM